MAVPFDFVAGTTALAAQVNANFAAVDTNPTTTSAGAADAGRGGELDSSGRFDRTLLAPDGYQKQQRIVLSDTGNIGNLGNFGGTALDGLLQLQGTSDLSTGIQTIKWGNDTKGVQDYIGKSRGATYGDMAVLVAGDRIYTRSIQAAADGGYFGHVGYERWILDGTPDTGSEMHGRWQLGTGTGNNSSEDPVYYGLKLSIDANSKQQVYFPGKLTTSVPAANANFGAIVRIGIGGANPGEAAMLFDLTSAALMTAPAAGAYEVDATGAHWATDVNSKRDAVLVGQAKVGGDSGAVAVGAGAGSGATVSAVWGRGCARVTLVTGSGPSADALFTLTYPHTFSTISFAFLQAGNAVSGTYVGRNCYTTPTTANVVVSAQTTAPAGATTYIFDVFFQGY